MIIEDYVSFEIAKLLKDKGFDVPCRSNYRSKYKDCKVPFYHNAPKNFNDKEYEGLNSEWFSAPTLQMAIKWLREVHKLHIEFVLNQDVENEESVIENYYHFNVSHLDRFANEGGNCKFYNSYEEATEEAIKYCLKNLI